MSAPAAQRAPDGFALVPLIPTPKMVEVGCENNPTMWTDETDDSFAATVANDIYVSMVRTALTSTSAPQEAPDRSVQQALSDMIVVYNNIYITLANNGVGWSYFRKRDLEQMFAKVKAAKEVLAAVTPAERGDQS